MIKSNYIIEALLSTGMWECFLRQNIVSLKFDINLTVVLKTTQNYYSLATFWPDSNNGDKKANK